MIWTATTALMLTGINIQRCARNMSDALICPISTHTDASTTNKLLLADHDAADASTSKQCKEMFAEVTATRLKDRL